MNQLRLTQSSTQPGTFHIRIHLQIPDHNPQTAESDFSFSLSDDEIMALYNSQSEDTVLHDEAGNLVMDQRGYQYEYDHDNRLTKITQDSTDIAEFTYDALGRRIEKIEYDTTNITTRYYYDGWRVLSETNEDGTHQRHYVYGNYLDEALMLIHDDGEASPTYTDYYYAHNHLYSPVALIEDDGDVVERYEYDVYGKQYVMEEDYDPRVSSIHDNVIAFTGQRLDSLDSGDLQLMYYKNRYYSTDSGRFLQRDPIAYIDGMNTYEYAMSNTIRYLDKFGLNISSPQIPPIPDDLLKQFLWFLDWFILRYPEDRDLAKYAWPKPSYPIHECCYLFPKHYRFEGASVTDDTIDTTHKLTWVINAIGTLLGGEGGIPSKFDLYRTCNCKIWACTSWQLWPKLKGITEQGIILDHTLWVTVMWRTYLTSADSSDDLGDLFMAYVDEKKENAWRKRWSDERCERECKRLVESMNEARNLASDIYETVSRYID